MSHARPRLPKQKTPNQEAAKTIYEQGLKLHTEEKNYTDAMTCYDKAIELDPFFPDPYMERGNAILMLGKKPDLYQGIADYTVYGVLASNKYGKQDDRSLQRKLISQNAIMYSKLGCYDVAIRLYGEAIALEGENIPEEKAEKEAKKAADRRASLAACYFEKLHHEKEKMDDDRYFATILYAVAYGGDPQTDSYFNDLFGWICENKNKSLDLIAFIQKNIHPTSVQILLLKKCLTEDNLVGDVLFRAGGLWRDKRLQIEGLINQLEKNVSAPNQPKQPTEQAPKNAEEYYVRGKRLIDDSRSAEAIADFLVFITLHEMSASIDQRKLDFATFNIGVGYSKEKQFDYAAECYTKVIEKSDEFRLLATIYRAEVYDLGNHLAKAIFDYCEALKLADPTSKEYAKVTGELKQLLDKQRNKDVVLDAINSIKPEQTRLKLLIICRNEKTHPLGAYFWHPRIRTASLSYGRLQRIDAEIKRLQLPQEMRPKKGVSSMGVFKQEEKREDATTSTIAVKPDRAVRKNSNSL